MGHEALNYISSLTPLLLGMAGVCACIALAMALGRHFLYEHGNDDLQPLSKRVTHVFGFLAAIGFTAVGGTHLATRWAASEDLNPAVSGSGTSLLPTSLATSSGKTATNLGDLLMSLNTSQPTKMTKEEAQAIVKDFMDNGTANGTTEDEYQEALQVIGNQPDSVQVGGF